MLDKRLQHSSRAAFACCTRQATGLTPQASKALNTDQRGHLNHQASKALETTKQASLPRPTKPLKTPQASKAS